MIYWLVFLFFFFVGILIYIEYKRTQVFITYYNLFLIWWFLYTIGVYFSDDIVTYNMKIGTLLSLIAGIFFIIGYNLVNLTIGYKSNFRFIRIKKLPNIKFILLFLLLLAISFFVYVVVIKIGMKEYFFTTRAHRSLICRNYSKFMIFIDLFNIVTVLSLFYYLVTKKKFYKYLFYIAFIFAVSHAIMTISRNALILVGLPVIFILHYFNYVKIKTILILLIVALFIGVIWKSVLFHLLLSNDGFSFSEIVNNLKFPREFVVWEEITNNILNNDISFNGRTYLNTFISLFYPFYHFKHLSIWYVENFEFSTFEKGGGRGFSNILEAYLNFNILGVIIVFFLLGVIVNIFQRIANKSIIFFLSYSFSLAFVQRIFRSDFTSLLKTWWWMYFISFILLFSFIYILQKASNENYISNKC